MQVTEPGYKTSQPEVTFEIKLSEQQTVTTSTIHQTGISFERSTVRMRMYYDIRILFIPHNFYPSQSRKDMVLAPSARNRIHCIIYWSDLMH